MTHEQKKSETKLTIERAYRATVQEAWELWTTKEGFESWWGPQGFRVEVRELDARVGGVIRYEMIAEAPEMIAAMKQMGQPVSHGVLSTFTELQPRKRLVLTNVIDFLPGVTPYESHIAADFIATDDGVRMVVTLDALHDPQWTQRQLEGMTSQIGKLDQRFPPLRQGG